MKIMALNALQTMWKKYGLNIYGFTVLGKKTDILELSKQEQVAYIYETDKIGKIYLKGLSSNWKALFLY